MSSGTIRLTGLQAQTPWQKRPNLISHPNNDFRPMTAPLGIAVILVAGGLTGLVRYYGKGWPWYVSAIVGFVLYWPGLVLLLFLYSALGLDWSTASSASVIHSLMGVIIGGVVMSTSFESSDDT